MAAAPRPPGATVVTAPELFASYTGDGAPPSQPASPAADSSLSSAADAPPPAVSLRPAVAPSLSGGADDGFVHVGPPPADPKPQTPRLATEAASTPPSPTASELGSSGSSAPRPSSAPPASLLPPVSAKQLAPQTSPTPGGPNMDDDPVSAASLAYLLAQKTYKVVQHFVIRSPHMFVSISVTFYVCKFFGDEPFAWEAATFVGVASAVHCLIKPIFIMIIPYSLLPRKTYATWRTFINATNTVLITISLSTAVWGLKIPAWQGTAIWVGSFGVPYGFLSKQYPDIDDRFPDSDKEPPAKKA